MACLAAHQTSRNDRALFRQWQRVRIHTYQCGLAHRTTEPFQDGEMPDIILAWSRALLDFYRVELTVSFDKAVDFLAVPVPIEVHGRSLAAVPPAFKDLGNDPGFEDCSRHGSVLQGFRRRPARQVRDKTGIEKIHLGSFGQPLRQVAGPRLEQIDNARNLKDRQPVPGRSRRNLCVLCQLRVIQKLACPGRAHAQEAQETVGVADLCEIFDIALKISIYVLAVEYLVKLFRLSTLKDKASRVITFPQATEQTRIGAAPDMLVQLGKWDKLAGGALASPRQKGRTIITITQLFAKRQTGKAHDTDSSGQRFRNAPHQMELLGTGKPELSRRIGGVYLHLQVGQYLWSVLNLVNENRKLQILHEKAGIGRRHFAAQRIVKAHISLNSGRLHHLPKQRCLSDLSRSSDQDNRKKS